MMIRSLVRVAAVLACCVACDAENVRWAFVSNPGGSFDATSGAVIVVRATNSSSLGLAGDFVRIDGVDRHGPLSVLLPHAGDFAVLVRGDSTELRSPVLASNSAAGTRPGRFEAAGAEVLVPPAGGPAALRIQLPNAAIVHPFGIGPGTLHVARAGTLLILESAAGLIVFGESADPEVVGTSATLTTTPAGNAYALRLSDDRIRPLQPLPLPLPAQRLFYNPQRGSVRILGPLGEVLAEVPAAAVTLHNGAGGLFLLASLPQGIPSDRTPMQLLMATDNRYLLRVEQ